MLGRAFKPFIINNNVNRPLSQVLWADAIYVKNFMDYDSISAEKLMKLAVILHDVYDSYDLVHYILSEYDKQTSAKCAEQYLHLLCKDGNLWYNALHTKPDELTKIYEQTLYQL